MAFTKTANSLLKEARILGNTYPNLDRQYPNLDKLRPEIQDRIIEDSAHSKANEEPTSNLRAIGIGGSVGGGLGALLGRGGKGRAVGALVGAGLGGLLGKGAREGDKLNIEKAREDVKAFRSNDPVQKDMIRANFVDKMQRRKNRQDNYMSGHPSYSNRASYGLYY